MPETPAMAAVARERAGLRRRRVGGARRAGEGLGDRIIGIVPAGADEAGAALRKPRRRCRYANGRVDAAFLRSRLQRPSTQLEQGIVASD